MTDSSHVVAFTLDERRFALPLDSVDRVVRIVEITSLPGAPQIILGVVNVQGRVLPVINLRKRCGIPDREIELTDLLIIAHTTQRSVALWVDAAEVVDCPAESVIGADSVVPDLNGISDVVKRQDGLIVIYDPSRFLSLDEDAELTAAMIDHGRPV